MNRHAVVGSRDFPKLILVRQHIATLPPKTIVISGTEPSPLAGWRQRTVDQTAIFEARQRGLETVVHEAQWAVYRRAAGPIRNFKIAQDCNDLTAFWWPPSNGTRDVLRSTLLLRKPVTIIFPDGGTIEDTQHLLPSAPEPLGHWLVVQTLDDLARRWIGTHPGLTRETSTA